MGTRNTEDRGLNATFQALAHHFRRDVVRYLINTADGTTSTDELTAHLASNQDNSPTGEEIRTRLYHVTLPKLADAGIIEYDARSENVRYRDDPLVEQCLRTIGERGD